MSYDFIGDTSKIWEKHITSNQKLLFFYRAIIKTIDACLAGEYTKFDGHTTTNCCHGIALLASKLVCSVLQLDLMKIKQLLNEKVTQVESNPPESLTLEENISQELLLLMSLYVLAATRDFTSEKKMRTEAKKLREISHVGVEFCWQLVNVLKKHVSNMVAYSYQSFVDEIPSSILVNGIPVSVWGNYVSHNYIRVDKRGIYYTSCVFSTQVVLGFLLFSGAKIAFVNDIFDSNKSFIGRHIYVLEGDRKKSFKILSEGDLKTSNKKEPTIVFAGYAYTNNLDAQQLPFGLNSWINNFPGLMLACDAVYPQFPKVHDDLEFDSSPVLPQEENLQRVLYNHATVQGVSASDPSLFCSSHTYCASLEQVLEDKSKKKGYRLPICFHGLQIQLSNMWGKEMKGLLSSSLQ